LGWQPIFKETTNLEPSCSRVRDDFFGNTFYDFPKLHLLHN
jgi:hypothetical protein